VSGGVANSFSGLISPEVTDTALSCTALSRARNLAEWVGPGKTLTARGVLRPAEAAQACRDLGIELPGPRLRSALDVDDLMRDWVTAAVAGFLEMDGRRVRAAQDLPEAGSSAHADPDAILHGWVQAATVLLDVGEQPCAGCLTVLHELYSADGPLTMDQLASAVRAVLEPEEPEGPPCPDCGEVHGPGDLLGVGDFLSDEDEDEEDAASHAADTVTGLLGFAAADVAGEAVRLTSLGTVLAASVFQGRAPSPDADAATVMSAISELPPPVAWTVAQPWLGARSAADAARELLAFAESADGGQRVASLTFAGDLGSDAADAWREWAKRPGIGAYARQWLRSQGEEVPEDPADEEWLAVDGLSVMLDALADTVPPFLIQAMLAEQFGGQVTDVAEQMLSSGHPRAQDIAALMTGRPALAATRGPASARQSQPRRSGRSGVSGRSSGERRRPGSGTLVHQLKITLCGVSRPPVWRRVLVPADVTLEDLHEVIQQAMGWDNGHMHVFSTGGQEYGSPDPELGHASDRKVILSHVLASPGDRLRYTYDFGDDWEHDIVLEETQTAVPNETYPSCVAGKGACPPEDCGGAWGYAELKEILADPSHEDHQDMVEWLGLDTGKDFDPKKFSVTEVNARLPLANSR